MSNKIVDRSSSDRIVDRIVAGNRFVGPFFFSPFSSFHLTCSPAQLIGGIVAAARCDASSFAFSLLSSCHIVPIFFTESSALNVYNSGGSWLNFTFEALGVDGGGTTYFLIIVIRYLWIRSRFDFCCAAGLDLGCAVGSFCLPNRSNN